MIGSETGSVLKVSPPQSSYLILKHDYMRLPSSISIQWVERWFEGGNLLCSIQCKGMKKKMQLILGTVHLMLFLACQNMAVGRTFSTNNFITSGNIHSYVWGVSENHFSSSLLASLTIQLQKVVDSCQRLTISYNEVKSVCFSSCITSSMTVRCISRKWKESNLMLFLLREDACCFGMS